MHRLLTRVGFVIAATAASLALTSVPADAATLTFYDGNAPGSLDVTKVKVTNGTTNLTVTANVGSMTTEDKFYLWVDTDAKNAGPEYRGTVMANTEWFKVRKVGSFSDSGKYLTGDCWVQGKADIHSAPTVTWKIKRSCMKNPGKVRVTVKARYLAASGVVTDWAPGYRKFSPWVAKG